MGIQNMDYLIADPNLIYSNEKELYSEKFHITNSESNEFIEEFIDDLKIKGFLI